MSHVHLVASTASQKSRAIYSGLSQSFGGTLQVRVPVRPTCMQATTRGQGRNPIKAPTSQSHVLKNDAQPSSAQLSISVPHTHTHVTHHLQAARRTSSSTTPTPSSHPWCTLLEHGLAGLHEQLDALSQEGLAIVLHTIEAPRLRHTKAGVGR